MKRVKTSHQSLFSFAGLVRILPHARAEQGRCGTASGRDTTVDSGDTGTVGEGTVEGIWYG